MRLRVMDFFKQMFKRFFACRVLDLSAQCAYYFMLSMFPFLIVVISLLSYLPVTAEDIFKLVGNVAPTTSSEAVARNLEIVLGVRHSGIMSVGIVFTIWSTLSGIDSLMRALNYSYGISTRRGYFKSKLIALILMVGMILGICSALIFTVLGAKIGQLMELYFNLPYQVLELWNIFRLITSFVILSIVFLILYLIAPNKKVRLLEALPGCLFASIGWHYVSLGFSFYVNRFNNYSATYGGLGAIIVLMVWFYLTAMILILGGQINSVLAEMRRS